MDAIADEKALLLLVAEGDRGAFKSLYDHYWNDLYSLALSFLKSPDWAQDTVQDLFLKVWVKRDSLTAIEKFNAYIFIMLRNEIISALRHRDRTLKLYQQYQRRIPADFLLPGVPGGLHASPAPDSDLDLRELERLIRRAVAQLPPPQGLLIELTREQGLSHDEIAGRLGMARKTVSNTLTKALNNIRKYLREHGQAG